MKPARELLAFPVSSQGLLLWRGRAPTGISQGPEDGTWCPESHTLFTTLAASPLSWLVLLSTQLGRRPGDGVLSEKPWAMTPTSRCLLGLCHHIGCSSAFLCQAECYSLLKALLAHLQRPPPPAQQTPLQPALLLAAQPQALSPGPAQLRVVPVHTG